MTSWKKSCALAGVLAGFAPFASAQVAESGTLDEVIVTAQRVEENLQKAAAAITALDGQALIDAGISQPGDLNKLVPGLGIGAGGPSTQVYLRGVGNYGTNGFADPAVAFNVDGIYMARFTGLNGIFFDLQRIEVLKGPQGTLYGRNATGGAINLIAIKPTRQTAASVGVELGNYSLRKVNGMVNGALSARWSARLAFQLTDRKGYLSDGYNDDRADGFRLAFKFDASDDTSLLLTGMYSKTGGRGQVHVPININGFYDNKNPYIGPSVAAAPMLQRIAPAGPNGPFANWQNRGVSRADGNLKVKVQGLTSELNTKAGGNDLTILANYMKTDNNSKSYGPGFLFFPDEHDKQWSIEGRLAGTNGPVKWVAGLYAFQEDQEFTFWVDQGYRFNQTGVDVDSFKDQTSAAFAQLTYSFSDTLRATAGLRFTRESKDISGQTFSREGLNNPPFDTFIAGPPPAGNELGCVNATRVLISTVAAAIPQAATNTAGDSYIWPYCRDVLSGKQTFNDTSWKVGLDWDVNPTSMMYTSLSRGFKAGGFFAAGNGADLTGNKFNPETLTALALGSKNRFSNSRLQLNGEAFYWDYKDHQENYLAPLYTSAPGFGFVTQTADAHIYGLDLEFDALLTDNDKLSTKLQYLKAEYTRATFINASPGAGNPPPVSACPQTQDANPTIWRINCKGQEMPRSPKVSLTADYSHTIKLSNGGAVIAGVTGQYSAAYWAAVDYNPLQRQKSFTRWDADLGYHAPDGKWSLTAWGANLTDELVYTNAFMYPASNNTTNYTSFTQLAAPKTYGLRFSAKL